MRTLMQTKIILASGSPRRRELLSQIGLSFEVIPSDVDEIVVGAFSPIERVMELAKRKCIDVARAHPDALVIGADTIVVFEGDVLGKPGSNEIALEMLKRLNGRSHEVITGVSFACVKQDFCKEIATHTEVTFHSLSEQLMAAYVATGEPLDKAGGYGIQGKGIALVKSISGSYSNIVGLPLEQVVLMVREFYGDDILFD